jgi:peptidoglycan hydrolase CwlO-like protein
MKKGMIAAALSAALLLSSAEVFAATTQEQLDQAKQQTDSSKSQLSTVEESIAALESKKSEAEAYLSTLNSQVSDINSQISSLEQKYTDKQNELDQVTLELEQAKEDEEQQRSSMDLRIQFMYEHSEGNGALQELFTSGSITEFLNRADNFSNITSYDRKKLEEYAQTCQEVEDKEKKVEDEQAQIDTLRQQTESKKSEVQQLLDQTSAQVNEFAANIADQQSQAAQLASQIQQQQSQVDALTKKAADEVAAADAQAAAAKQQAAAQTAAKQQTSSASSGSSRTGSGGSTAPSAGNAQKENSDPSSYYIGSGVLTKSKGVVMGPSGKETYYNMNMSGVVRIMRNMGNNDPYWVRSDGVKMLGDYVMVAANLSVHPRGSHVSCSLGQAIVCDTGTFALSNPNQLDIAVNW